ncbi:MAG: MBL fold metallo-hydrolase [Sphingomonadales bacterium]|nr:MBL fold metallo-hydrolase [Sphingomonadales bacterium]
MTVDIKNFFDKETFSYTYVISDPVSKAGVIIDSVLNYDMAAGKTSTTSADAVCNYVKSNGIDVKYILESHVHADHLTASVYLQEKLGGTTAVGEGIKIVQQTFAPVFDFEESFKPDGSQFDQLLQDGDELSLGEISIKVMHTPGHTPACVSYVVGDAIFVGDTLFMPDFGTARTDFPGGDAKTLCASLRKILAFPEATRLFMCHDYAPGGREYNNETTVAEQKKSNIHIHDGVSDDEFVKMREGRDKQLGMPKLILPAVQINMRAGHFPPKEENGVEYLKIPLNQF